MSARLADEVPGSVSMYAFGVGRGVDRKELLRIIGAGGAAASDAVLVCSNPLLIFYVRSACNLTVAL
jgi:hypothetical protein